MRGKNWVWVVFFVACAVGFAFGQATTLENVSYSGEQANHGAIQPVVTPDGQIVAFSSLASNLVPGDANGKADVFLRVRYSGHIEIVSVSSGGVQGNDHSGLPSITPDGRFVAFWCKGNNLVPNAFNAGVYLRDRWSYTTVGVSVTPGGILVEGDHPSISADGRYVAFESPSAMLVPGDTNNANDVFVWDRLLNWVTRVSVSTNGIQGNASSDSPAISADGRFVTFRSWADNFVSNDTNRLDDIFVHDRMNGQTVRVNTAGGRESNGYNLSSTGISADNRFVVFGTVATNLVPEDPLPDADIYVHDRETGILRIVSRDFIWGKGNGDSYMPVISPDGLHVGFTSWATNFDPGDRNEAPDVFVADMDPLYSAIRVRRASLGSFNQEGERGAGNFSPALSQDGRFVAFYSEADSLVPGQRNVMTDIFVRDRLEGARGTVNSGRGAVTDVLYVNGNHRVLRAPAERSVFVQLERAPLGPSNAVWGLWFWMGPPVWQTELSFGRGFEIGWTVNPTSFEPRPPQPFPWIPQPFLWIVGQGLPIGIGPAQLPAGFLVTVQGFVQDAASANPLGVSLTNAVIVEITAP